MTLKEDWVDHAQRLMVAKADLFVGPRKIIRNKRLSFDVDNSLQVKDAGYTQSKISMLRRHYFHEESHASAVDYWKTYIRRRAKFQSVGFSTYNHTIKRGGRGGLMAPCLQSVVITWLDKQTYTVGVHTRMAELLKKFPADLIFVRDVLLKPFDFSGMEMKEMVFHFDNITMTAAYYLTIAPHLDDPIAMLEKIKKADPKWYPWLIRWTAYYLCSEHEAKILKFSQAIRAQADAKARLSKQAQKQLRDYARANHPRQRSKLEDDDMDGED